MKKNEIREYGNEIIFCENTIIQFRNHSAWTLLPNFLMKITHVLELSFNNRGWNFEGTGDTKSASCDYTFYN